MAIIKGQVLSPSLLEAIKFSVKQIPQNELDVYASSSDAFASGGFRKGNVAVIRARIIALIEGSELIEDALKRLLAKHNECYAVISKLSGDIVKTNIKQLETLFGYPQFQLALMLDTRFSDLAISQLENKKEDIAPSEEERLWAVKSLRETIWPVFSALGTTEGESSTPTATSSFESQRLIKELRAELNRLKGTETKLQREQIKLTYAETAEKKYLERAEKAEKAEGELRQRAERAEAELIRNKRDAQTQANAIVQTKIAEELTELLGVRRVEQLYEFAGSAIMKKISDDPLLSRASAAINAQAKSDIASGTRAALEAKLESYEEMLLKCRGMIADALDPSEELRNIANDIESEVTRIRKILYPGKNEQESVNTTELLTVAINSSADRQLPDLQHTVNKLLSIGVISETAASNLTDMIRRRYAIRYAKRGGPGLENGDPECSDQILYCALNGQIPLILLIDGHNTLFALQSRYSRPQDHRGPSAEAREWLINDIVQTVSCAHNCRVIIVFDGPERTDSFPSGNVKVIYSGGGKSDVEHRADDVIVDEVRFLSETNSTCKILLATNDNGLACRAASYGAKNIAPTSLLEYFK